MCARRSRGRRVSGRERRVENGPRCANDRRRGKSPRNDSPLTHHHSGAKKVKLPLCNDRGLVLVVRQRPALEHEIAPLPILHHPPALGEEPALHAVVSHFNEGRCARREELREGVAECAEGEGGGGAEREGEQDEAGVCDRP